MGQNTNKVQGNIKKSFPIEKCIMKIVLTQTHPKKSEFLFIVAWCHFLELQPYFTTPFTHTFLDQWLSWRIES